MANSDHLGPIGHALAHYALARLDMVEMAFSRLPGAETVDLAEIKREASLRWERRAPTCRRRSATPSSRRPSPA